ncbi:hypothetical protein C8035_v001114 [Colletotrichum spinosum]|uniref:Myb-like DNA-binding domain-containing protein n=1 Tax=Colletotrichum spinosum TaxID=1347390 RepID=A0A4V3HT40_9PEZI|nr:hypothetical protein C8035_v001114 [Colletotrichum spinosum]
MSASSSTAKEPTQGDLQFAFLLLKHMQEKPVVDWESVATEGGFKNKNVVVTRWGQIKKKYMTDAAPAAAASTASAGKKKGAATKVTKATGRVGTKGGRAKGKGKAEESEAEDSDRTAEADEPKVAKAAKATARAAAKGKAKPKAEAEAEDEDAVEDENAEASGI